MSWTDGSGVGGDNSELSIKAQVFDAAGANVGSEFLVNTVTAGNQNVATVTGLSSGGFVVSWLDDSGQSGDTSDSSIKAQLFDANGAKVGGEFLVNTTVENGQYNPRVASLSDGGFVVSWSDYSGQGGDSDGSIKAQLFDSNGAKVGGEFLVNTTAENYQFGPSVAGLSNSDFVVSWFDYSGQGGDSSGSSIKAQIFGRTATPPSSRRQRR